MFSFISSIYDCFSEFYSTSSNDNIIPFLSALDLEDIGVDKLPYFGGKADLPHCPAREDCPEGVGHNAQADWTGKHPKKKKNYPILYLHNYIFFVAAFSLNVFIFSVLYQNWKTEILWD